MKHVLRVSVAVLTLWITTVPAEPVAAVSSPVAETSILPARGLAMTDSATCTGTKGCSWEQWVAAIEGTYEMIGEICGDAGGYAQLWCEGNYVVGYILCALD